MWPTPYIHVLVWSAPLSVRLALLQYYFVYKWNANLYSMYVDATIARLYRLWEYATGHRRALTVTYTTIAAVGSVVGIYHAEPPAIRFTGWQSGTLLIQAQTTSTKKKPTSSQSASGPQNGLYKSLLTVWPWIVKQTRKTPRATSTAELLTSQTDCGLPGKSKKLQKKEF